MKLARPPPPQPPRRTRQEGALPCHPPPFSTLVSVLGPEAGGDPVAELPQRLKDVSGSTPMADLILSAVGFILELSELDEIHLKSYERAQSNQSMAIYTAKLLYNDAVRL